MFRLRGKVRKYCVAYFLISPFLIIFGIFWLFPLIYSFVLSFHKYSGFQSAKFIGLDNFLTLFRDERFWIALKNNIYLWLGMVPLRTFLALLLAFLLNSTYVKFKGFFRVVYLLPYVIAIVIVAVMFKILLAYHGGLVNTMLHYLGFQAIPWLESKPWDLISVIIAIFWQNLGYFTIIMLGGLQRIRRELYEAARIDGASESQLFIRITIPLMKPIILFIVVMSTIWLSKIFAQPLILTDGGPNYSSTTLTLLLYRYAFGYFKLGYASSLAMTVFWIILVLTIIQLKYLGEKEEQKS